MKIKSFKKFLAEGDSNAELEKIYASGKVLSYKDEDGGISTAETLAAAKMFGLRKNNKDEWVNKRGLGPYIEYEKGEEPRLKKGSRSDSAQYGPNRNSGD